jgi:hypothetical protein
MWRKFFIKNQMVNAWLNQEKSHFVIDTAAGLWLSKHNRTRQGYARKCILKSAGLSFLALVLDLKRYLCPIKGNSTCQGYARKCILKSAGLFVSGGNQ